MRVLAVALLCVAFTVLPSTNMETVACVQLSDSSISKHVQFRGTVYEGDTSKPLYLFSVVVWDSKEEDILDMGVTDINGYFLLDIAPSALKDQDSILIHFHNCNVAYKPYRMAVNRVWAASHTFTLDKEDQVALGGVYIPAKVTCSDCDERNEPFIFPFEAFMEAEKKRPLLRRKKKQ